MSRATFSGSRLNTTGNFTQPRIDRLNGIGFEWDPDAAAWEQHFRELQAYKELISSTDMFRGLTQQATLRLAAQVNSKKFEDGEAIIHQGDEDGDEMFIVRSNVHH